MRLVEIFLNETTEEDRAIISLATAIYGKVESLEIEGHSKEYDYDDYDDEDTYDLSDPSDTGDDSPTTVGKIGELFDTPLEELNNVTIDIQSSEGIRARIKRDHADDVDSEIINGETVILGLWYSDINTVVLNSDYLGEPLMKSTISHELRHALDDYKSDYEANKEDGRYSRPKKKAHRRVTKDPYMGNLAYLAMPAEINARFIQVLHALVPIIQREVKKNPEVPRETIHRFFFRLLDTKRIGDLFPEKEKSKDYKRLVKRGADFIEKELAHAKLG